MITKEQAYQFASEFYPEVTNKRWFKVIDGLPSKAFIFDFENFPENDNFWLVQYSFFEKDSELYGCVPSSGIAVSKITGKILWQECLNDGG